MRTCPDCGQENPEAARFCLACGAALDAAPPARGEERRIVSVLFVDLVGSTALGEREDPEDVRALLDRYHARARAEIERFGGLVEKFIGDAVMAVFGAPVAHGDDAERAVRAALAVRGALTDVDVRIAVNTGEAVVALDARPGHGESMVAGDVVNTAARLQSAAPVNAVLVGEDTYLSTRGAIEYEPAEPVSARGKAEPVAVWLAVGAKTPVGERILSEAPLVGRQLELDLLRGIWERAVSDRRAHLVTIIGPPGIGKSRLAWDFAELVPTLGGRMIRGRSAPYGESAPYAAFSSHLKQVAGIFDSDPPDVAAAKLAAAVADLHGLGESPDVTAHLASILGTRTASEPADRQTLFGAARSTVEQLAARQPLLLVFEDLQWADASMLDLLDELAARLHDTPIMLLAVSRPELLTHRPAWGGGLPAYTALQLEPLGDDHARELAEHLLGEGPVDRILEIAEGNPLFIEELSASIAERGAEELPTNIRAIIAARLDALPDAERALLLDASVVGRVFWDGSLPGPDVPTLLGSLERRDFIRREPISRLQGQQQFRFKHILIRDIAYAQLTRPARRTRHEAVARFLEETTVETAAAADAIAHHWLEAGDTARAADFLVAAADDAARGWAKARAVELYTEAVALMPESDPRRRDVQLRLAVAVQALFHIPDAERLRRS